jgi:hypothetical protein
MRDRGKNEAAGDGAGVPAGGRYPGYDVLSKRNSPSWNDKTREVVNARMAVPREPRFFDAEEFATVVAIAERLVPQRVGAAADRALVPVAALVDAKLVAGREDGYRQAGMPKEREAWRLGLRALDAEAKAAHGGRFVEISAEEQVSLLRRMQVGELRNPAWEGMKPAWFFKHRMGRDVVMAYYAHPTAWSEIGWGGPASPRGYVRMDFDERDPWEAAEVKDGDVAAAMRANRRV